MKPREVKDRFGLVYATLVVLGVGTMLPFNVFMTEAEFFNIRLHVAPFTPSVSDNFISLFGLAFNASNLAAIIVMLWLQQGWSLRSQVVSPLLVIFVVMASTALVALRLDLSGDAVAAYSLPAMAVNGICMAVLQGGLLNLASMFPPIYIQGYIVGAGLSGVATSALSFFSQLEATQDDGSAEAGGGATPAEVAPAAAVYFGIAAAIIGVCVASYSFLGRLEYARAKLGPYIASRRAALEGAPDLVERLLPPPAVDPMDPPVKPSSSSSAQPYNPDALPAYSAAREQQRELWRAGDAEAPPRFSRAASDALAAWSSPERGPSADGGAVQQPAPALTALQYYRQSHPESALAGGALHPLLGGAPPPPPPPRSAVTFLSYCFAIVLTMAASMAVWPGVTGFMCSVHNPASSSPCAARTSAGRFAGDLFVPATFVAFGVGDVVGRVSSSWGPWGRRPPQAALLLLYSAARFALAAALLFCHVVTPRPWLLPNLPLLANDAAPLAIIFALGLTQGHLLSTACMHAPAVVPPGKEAEFGPVTGFCITAGCLAGSGGSYFLVKYLAPAAAI